MKNRNEIVVRLRPEISTINQSIENSESEIFQNKSLRQILKFQHPILILFFKEECSCLKKLEQNSAKEYELIIKDDLAKNLPLWNKLLGFVLGFLSTQEMHYYFSNKKELNKRIKNMLAQRIASAID